jgi:hypothetical protein
MIPLVMVPEELRRLRVLVERAFREAGSAIPFTVGTMIELPRACVVADRIAEHADFFSFGTNDLTQTALGFSRDDVESKFVPIYMERKIIDRSPFETIDRPGVGWLVRLAAWVGREAHPGLKLGVCGEHGGDPESIVFFQEAGLDYVSCSPFRVPIARLAAAQAQLEHPRGEKPGSGVRGPGSAKAKAGHAAGKATAKPVAKTKTASKPKAAAKTSKPKAKVAANPKAKPAAKPKSKTAAKPKARAKAAARPAVKPKTKTKATAKAKGRGKARR